MKWLKFLIALLLTPLIVAQLWTLTDLFMIWAPTSEWRTLWFGSFCGGFSLLMLLFFTLPKNLWVYVLGHELTHAWAVYLSGGTVFDFKVTSEGGHIKSDVLNWFVALSPYFVPLYTFIWTMLWISVDFYYPLDPYTWIFYAGLGFTWAFHVCFTIQMILYGQSDLTGQGTFFSLAVILGMNLILIFVSLVTVSPSIQFLPMIKNFGIHTLHCYQQTALWIFEGAGWVIDKIQK